MLAYFPSLLLVMTTFPLSAFLNRLQVKSAERLGLNAVYPNWDALARFVYIGGVLT